MSLLEMYKEQEKQLYATFDEIHAKCNEAIEAAGNEFLDKFKAMIADASDDEFHEFMCNSGNELNDIERMAALTARLENYGKRCRENESNEPEDKHKDNGHRVVIIDID